MAQEVSPSPLQSDQDIINVEVFCDGSQIKDTELYVYSLDIEHAINSVSKARLVLADGSPSKQDFEITNSDKFSPGSKVKINVGYRQGVETAFEGFVISTGVKVKEGQHSRIFIECVSDAYRMTIGRKNRYFAEMDDSDIISDIVSAYNSISQGSVEETGIKHKNMVQYNSTDWDFALMRAEANGMIVYTQENDFTVRKPQMNSSPVLEIVFGRDLISCELQADARYQLKGVTCFAWDSSEQKIVKGESAEAALLLNTQGDSKVSGETMSDFVHPWDFKLHTSSPRQPKELDKWANGQLLKSRFSRIRGVVKFQGSSKVKCDSVISLVGFSDYFNGDAYISKVVHRLEEGNWTTDAHIGFSSQWFAESAPNINMAPAAGLLPGIDGLYNGVVTTIHDDPDGEFRIQIKIPVISETDTIWARMSSIYASKDFGVFFRPEINDEVIVGFLQNDPQHPVILGSLHSKKLQPFHPHDANNTIKGIVTKNKLKLTFEDEKKNILIETPGGNKITISDENKSITIEDANSNKIVMDNSGITIDSGKDINIKAQGKINVNATQNIIAESKAGDISMAALNVKSDAKIMASVKGNMAELKGNATTEIKGGIVRIN